MKKKYLFPVIFFFLLSNLFSFEWGGLVSENFKISTIDLNSVNNANVRQSNGIALWANIPFTNDGDWYLATQGSYKYNYDFTGFNKNPTLQNIVDLDLFKLNGLIKINSYSFSLSLGRYFVVDNTAKVFAQNCDGISLKFSTQAINLGLFAGYTGLINGNNVVTLAKDGTVQHFPQEFYGKTYPYLPLSATITIPSLVFNQSLGVQFNAFLDLNETQEKYNRLYGTLTLQGPIYGPIYYSLNSCFGCEDFSKINNLSILSFMFFYQAFTVKLNCEYASGEQWIFKPFRGFNSMSPYKTITNPEYSGLLLPGLEFVFSLKDLFLSFSAKYIMLFPEEVIIHNGFDFEFKSIINIYSDLSFDMAINFYDDFDLNKSNENALEDQYFSYSMGLSIAF